MIRRTVNLTNGCRRWRIVRAVIVAALSSLVTAPTASAQIQHTLQRESIDSYLDRHGLHDLLVVHLEEELRQALGEDRLPIAERLAELYSELFDQAANATQRREWEERSLALRDRVPEIDTPVLRINLAKARYMRAESVAERYRLRAATHEEMLEARRSMHEVAASLTDELQDFQADIRRIESQRIDPRDTLATANVAKALKDLDALASQAAYYAGWALYYEAWLTVGEREVTPALFMFGRILEGDVVEPSLDLLPQSLLGYEHIARSALGSALCFALGGRTSTALDWLDVIDSSMTHIAVQEQMPSYRLAVLFDEVHTDARASRPIRLQPIRDHIESTQAADRMTPGFARLAAVLALETVELTSGNPEARLLASEAVTWLSDMGELRQVLEIAEQFDLALLGRNSFAISYVLALRAHERAREAHGHDEPTHDSVIVDLYLVAHRQLLQTANRRDAEDFQSAASNARLLAAWSLYFAARFEAAAKAFQSVAAELDRKQREVAWWMYVVSFERLHRDSRSSESEESLRQALDEYLGHFPSSARSGRVRYRLVMLDGEHATLSRVEQLLQIPLDSDAYHAAQRAAEQMLYALFHRARSIERIDLGHRYLDTALPMLADSTRRLFAGAADTDEQRLFLLLSRRTLDVMLARGIARVSEARRILDRLQSAGSSGLADISGLANELGYRDFQIALLTGRVEEAAETCHRLWDEDPAGTYTVVATRELLTWFAQEEPGVNAVASQLEIRQQILTLGERLLESSEEQPSVSDATTELLMVTLAEAAHALAKARIDEETNREKATRWYGILLEQRPSNYMVLKANAELAEERGDDAQALAHWREALGKLGPTDSRWFESKFNLIRILMRTDVDHAREVLAQHELLHPGYGPSPWGERIAELAQQARRGRSRSERGRRRRGRTNRSR